MILFGLIAAPMALIFSQDSFSTPEPATFVLLSVGLAGIGLAAWRRNRKS